MLEVPKQNYSADESKTDFKLHSCNENDHISLNCGKRKPVKVEAREEGSNYIEESSSLPTSWQLALLDISN